MKKAKIIPLYISLTQQRLCCVPCAVQWVLLRRGLKLFEQEVIGKALGLIIPPKHRHLFSSQIKVSIKKPNGGYGTNETDGSKLNKFFKKHKIPLKVEKIFYSKIKNAQCATKLISDNLKIGNDIMIITYMSAIKRTEKYGHALLISEIILSKYPKVIVGDPSFSHKKFYELDLKKIINGMNKKFDGEERGLYIFSKK